MVSVLTEVMIGQGVRPKHWHPMADRLDHGQLASFLSQHKRAVKQRVNQLTSHRGFIEQHCKESIGSA